ncbi:MAG: hypothetical protein AAFQ82_15555 [Myxococcota bacterium]
MNQRHAHGFDPREPLPGEVTPASRAKLVALIASIVIFSFGLMVGVWMSPEAPDDLRAENVRLQSELKTARDDAADLRRQLSYGKREVEKEGGALNPAIAERHKVQGKLIAEAMRRVKAQGAGQLIDWFVDRWNRVLNNPKEDDRIERRAELLSRLVGGMAENLHPGDYVPWQTELLSGGWLAELHYDLDNDGLPGPRSARNRNDGFADKSICHVAMALNQSVIDAQILVMPELRCHERKNQMSAFLQGETFDDALDEFVDAAKRQGFLVLEKRRKKQRLILIGNGKKRR